MKIKYVNQPKKPGGKFGNIKFDNGDTMFVTDAPILRENTHQDFTVLSDGAPDT